MTNIDEILKKAQNILDEKRIELKKLENEKKDIILRYNNADEKNKVSIQKEMKESELKFNKLLEEVKNFNKKIKTLK